MDTTPEPPSPVDEFVKRAERLASGAEHHMPSWLRPGDPESRLPVLVALIAAIALQLAIPRSYTLVPRWPLIVLEVLLLVVLICAQPPAAHPFDASRQIRDLGAAGRDHLDNTLSAIVLDVRIISGEVSNDAAAVAGQRRGDLRHQHHRVRHLVLGTGPRRPVRPARRRPGPIPTSCSRKWIPTPRNSSKPGWRPTFVDYLYVSITNVMAFSPTDTMPLARWAKAMMTVQAMVALTTAALVIARAVNVLG